MGHAAALPLNDLRKRLESSMKPPSGSEWGRWPEISSCDVADWIFRPEAGVGYEDGGWIAIPAAGRRAVTLTVTSWVGVSAVARHYYSTLRIHGLPFRKYPGEETAEWRSSPEMPPAAKGLRIRVEYPVTEEILKDGEDWEGFSVGDPTGRHPTLDTARDAAIAFFDARFEGDWALIDCQQRQIRPVDGQ